MGIVRILGLVLFAVGTVLLILGYQASQSVTERVVEEFTGHFTNRTTWYLIGGVAATVGGLSLSVWGGGRAAA